MKFEIYYLNPGSVIVIVIVTVLGVIALILSTLVHKSLRQNSVYNNPPALWWSTLLVGIKSSVILLSL